MRQKLKQCPFWVFWLICSLLYALVFNSIDFHDNPFSGFRGFVALFMQASVVALSGAGIIGLMSVNRYVFSLSFPILIILSSALGYFRLTVGVFLTPAVIDLMFVNDMNTWATLFSFKLVFILLFSAAASIFIVIYRWRFVKSGNMIVWTAVFTGIVLMPVCINRFKAPVIARMPYCFYFAFAEYFQNKKEIAVQRTAFDNVPVMPGSVSPDVIVILGESLRADHLGINGYPRPTTPNISADTAIVSYPHIYSKDYFTHESVPHIITRADSINPDLKWEEPSFITVFKKAGYQTSWISNQDMSPAYVYFMKEADALDMVREGFSPYSFNKHLDLDLLPYISDKLEQKGQPQLIVVHSIGSHWYYNAHYPDSLAVFKPEADSRVISDMTHEKIVNSYDNTIVATDNFISKVKRLLHDRNAILIYISDHGEALGEDGNYLHAADFPQLHYPACFFWYSQKYVATFPEKISNLRNNSMLPWTTDMVFHTAIDAADISTPVLMKHNSAMTRLSPTKVPDPKKH